MDSIRLTRLMPFMDFWKHNYNNNFFYWNLKIGKITLLAAIGNYYLKGVLSIELF